MTSIGNNIGPSGGIGGAISAGWNDGSMINIGYNKKSGPEIGIGQAGNANMYYPKYDHDKPEKVTTAALNNARKYYFETIGNTASDLWNSRAMRYLIAGTYYFNLSGVLTFVGGGSTDIGLALVTRGENAGSVYSAVTVKDKIGGYLGVSANVGRAMYTGKAQNYNFENTFLGYSSGLEGEYVVGASISFSEKGIY